jgi:cystathionine beta-lyase
VLIFADEIHADFVYSKYKHTSLITLGERYAQSLILGTSPSKTFNLAGLQIANIIIPNDELRLKFRRENDASGYSQANTLGLTATRAAYTYGKEWLEELKEYLEENLSFVRDYLKEKLPKVHLIEPEGTYLIWLDFSEISDDHKELEKLIVDEARLWLDPGIIFGRETALFERINIACPRKTLEQALEQLYEALEKTGRRL